MIQDSALRLLKRHASGLAGITMAWLALCLAPVCASQAADLMIYDDNLASGWEDWSWQTTRSVDTTRKVTGASSLAVSYTAGWAGLFFRTSNVINTSGYSSIRFSIYGRPGVGKLWLCALPDRDVGCDTGFEFTPPANVWTQYDVPWSSLGNPSQVGRVWIMDYTGSPVQPTYNLDTLRVIAKPTPALALSVDATANRKAISPLIYGINGQSATAADAAFMKSLGITVRRWGGNNTTRYNWKLDATNTGSDWYFENVRLGNGTNLPTDSAANRVIAQNRLSGAQTVMTVPLIGYVAKDSKSCGFSVKKYGAQQDTDTQWRPDCGNGIKPDGNTPITGNNPLDTSIQTNPDFVRNWVTYLVNRYGSAINGGVGFYNLDNELNIWWGTHRDVAPVGLKYDQIRDRTIQYAAAVKAADPKAQTLGPVPDGWTYYWHSPWDGQREDWDTPDDRNAHGGTPLVPWYLQQMRAYEKANGKRILDILDLHYYPQAKGVALQPAGNAATQALRLRSTRSLWDPKYIDESWIANAGPDGGIVKLIPRMRDWVSSNYPGTKLAITEYNWGGHENINGALAQADVLGIFGREGLYLATLWSPPQATQPVAFAFRIYRNYNGTGGKFGEWSVKADSNDQSRLAIYAAEENTTGALTLVLINKTAGSLSAPVTLSHYQPTGLLQGWQYSPAQLTKIVALANRTFTGTKFTASCPANSITLYRVPGKRL